MKCIILGAGYATRLYPLTLNRPKPLLPVGGVPILQRLCGQIRGIPELDSIHVVSNHRFADHYQRWGKAFRAADPSPIPIQIHDDGTSTPETRLGAIGDLQFVLDRASIDDDILVLAGDNLINAELGPFVEFGRAQGPAIGLKNLGSPERVSLYGVVETGENGRITGFEEKPSRPRSTLIAIGLYFFPRWTLPRFREYLESGQGKDAPGYFIQWFYSRCPVFGFVVPGEWFDIGELASYREADRAMAPRRKHADGRSRRAM